MLYIIIKDSQVFCYLPFYVCALCFCCFLAVMMILFVRVFSLSFVFRVSFHTSFFKFKSTFILYHINTPTLGLEFQHSNKNRQYFFSTDLIEFILCVLCVYNHFGLGTLGQSAQKLRCFIHFFSQRAQILISSKYLYEMEPNRTNDIISFSYSFALFPLCHHFYFRWQNHKMLPE